MARRRLEARITISTFNPYESPNHMESSPADGGAVPPPQSLGWVRHVRIVGILMIVQGSLDVLMGMVFIGTAAFFHFGVRSAIINDPEFQQNGPPPEAMFTMMSWGYAAVGGGTSLIGLLNIIAGIRNMMLKDRVLGMIALFLGLGASLNCYCMPTSVGLVVYGMIVYLNPAVIRAFQLRAQGYAAGDALAASGPTSPPQSPSLP